MANENYTPEEKINQLKKVINQPEAAYAENPTAVPESTKKVDKIEILEPEKFPIHEAHGYIRNTVLADKISEIMSAIFVDHVDSKVFWNPTRGGLSCVTRFKLCTPAERENMPDSKAKVVAVGTPASQVHADNAFTRTMKQINQLNNPSNGETYACLTETAKSYLSDYVIRNMNNKIDWNSLVKCSATQVPDYNGKRTTIVYVDVQLDINKVLYHMYNGTENSPNFKNMKYYSYSLEFVCATTSSPYVNGVMQQPAITDFIMRLIRKDQKELKKFCDETGFGAVPIMY